MAVGAEAQGAADEFKTEGGCPKMDGPEKGN